jgi:beta-galactosidase
LSDIFYYATDRFKLNGERQLKEIVLQNYNHPSVVMWGIFSLIWERGDKVVEYVNSLNAAAKRLDPSRPTVACSNQNGDINFITDLIVWQQNLGWQRGLVSDLAIWRQKLYDEWKHLKSAVAYGESGSIDQQTDEKVKPARIADRWLPERWHTEFHEGYAKHIAPDSIFWGVWINDMFDFGSARHISGASQRGVMTFDRKDHKDAYYLYRALWNKQEPTLHLSEKRRNIRQDSIQQVKFYASTAEKPILLINKDTVATTEIAPCQFISDTVIMHGRNKVVVMAGEKRDEQTITIGNALKQRR